MNGNCEKNKKTFSKWLLNLRKISISNSELLLGKGENAFSLTINKFSSSKYGHNLSAFFTSAHIEAEMDGHPLLLLSTSQRKAKNFQADKIKNKNKKFSQIDFVPESVKHWFHGHLSNVLIRHPRNFTLELDSKLLLKILVFFDVPFLFDGELKDNSFFAFDGHLAPGRNYHLEAKMVWKDFAFPRMVSNSARDDQLCVFVKRFFDSRPSFDAELAIYYKFRQFVESDRPNEVLSVFKILSAIYSVSIDEYFED